MSLKWTKLLLAVIIILVVVYCLVNLSTSNGERFKKDTDLLDSDHRTNDGDSLHLLRKELDGLREENDQLRNMLTSLDGSPSHSTLSFDSKPHHSVPNIEQCQFIHIAIVCAGYNTPRSLATLIKSLLFYRKNPIHLHIIADSIAQLILDKLFTTWDIPHFIITFYSADEATDDVAWIPNKHYSGVYGLLKLTLPRILPDWLDRVIVLDCDVTLAADVAELWTTFSLFSQKQVIGLVENQSDWYLGKLWKSYQPWPALGRGFNTGVMAMDLKKLRAIKWARSWRLTAEKDLLNHYSTSLADQDIFNAVIFQDPHLVYSLPCQFNVQLSDNTRSELCYTAVTHLKIIHWNSPKKLKVKNKHADFFRDLYLTFTGLDGNLLRRQLIHCNDSSVQADYSEPIISESDPCYDFRKARYAKYRTHIFFMEFQIDNNNNAGDSNDVTWISQLSFDRLQMLESLCKLWTGPISLALYLTDTEADLLDSFVTSSDCVRARKNIGYHIVYKQGDLYPINLLRNVALEHARTNFVFLCDIDFLPMANMQSVFNKYIVSMKMTSSTSKALVVPAFETLRYRADIPRTKVDLIAMWDVGDLFTFRYHVWPQGHAATNFPLWKTSTTPYKIKWEADFEPYIVVRRNVTTFDTRFLGFGWNKVSHLMELHVQGYEFHVLPNAFIVHLPHSASVDISKYRESSHYRMCSKMIKSEFSSDLKKRYKANLSVT